MPSEVRKVYDLPATTLIILGLRPLYLGRSPKSTDRYGRPEAFRTSDGIAARPVTAFGSPDYF
jgi:hypothetical protein